MQNYSCKECGATLYWSAEDGCLKCLYCDSTYQPSDFEDHTNVSEEKQKAMIDNPGELEAEYVAQDLSADMCAYECKTCGGEVIAMKTTMATICPYCGEAISISSKAVGEFRPEKCIPFAQEKKAVMDIYKKYVNSSFLTPKKFKLESEIEKIQGLFVPFYLHDIADRGDFEFEGEKITSRKVGYDKVDTHNVYSLTVKNRGSFNDVPTDAAAKIQDSLMDALEPFNYQEIKDFNPAFMAGYMAEQADDDKNNLNKRAENRTAKALLERARKTFIGYQGMNTIKNNVTVESHTSEYVMMPVWMLNVKHGEKKYTFAINGQTGKVVGKLPIDIWKTVLLSGAVCIATDLIAIVLNLL